MRILYKFHDNDFRHTFTEVFQVVLRAIEWRPDFKQERWRDKAYICALLNELAYPVYRAVQCYDFPGLKDQRFSSEEEQRAFYTKYFLATPDKIYIDREIDDLLAHDPNGNGEWFVLDSEQFDPKWRVYAI